jgi:ubiquinone/menaquinone biosynthesis C-methylase UbiE
LSTKEDGAVLWEQNAQAWTQLARMGYDIYRDGCNTPSFLEMLPRVRRLRGLDVGCGEGENTRHVARLGANMTGVDVSPTFIKHCRDFETDEKAVSSITYLVAKSTELPFFDQSFDFVISTMVLMDIEDLNGTLKEIKRVLNVEGFFQFSIVHPCFQTPGMDWVFDEDGKRAGIKASGYFEEGRIDDEWTFSAAPKEISSSFKPFKVAHHHRTLSQWMNKLVEAGFVLEALNEPTPSAEAIEKYPALICMREIPLFLHMRWSCRK